MIRLDKLLGHSGYGTRKEIKSLCKSGDVTVNGEIVRDSSVKVDEGATVIVAGEKVEYEAVSYLMLHKPAGVVSATQDSRVQTVLDILCRLSGSSCRSLGHRYDRTSLTE